MRAVGRSADAVPALGSLLRAQRLCKGLDLAAVADALHIRESYLSLIEGGRYEELPGRTYAAGFVRAYANHLDLDPAETLHQFTLETQGLKIGREPRFDAPKAELGVRKAALVVLSVLLVALSYGGAIGRTHNLDGIGGEAGALRRRRQNVRHHNVGP